LAQLKHITDCVRTDSVDYGLTRFPKSPRVSGIKVLQGLWPSELAASAAAGMFTTAIALAKRFPDVIAAGSSSV